MEHAGEQLFGELPSEVVAAFEAIKSVTHFPRGTALFLEGQPARGVFVVGTGRVRLSVCSESGKRLVLGIAGPREVLGLSASLSSGPHEVTAEALEDSDVAVVSRKNLLLFLHGHREACVQVARVLSQDLHVAYERLRGIGLKRKRRVPN
jgi:CRP-like cAMP-binding protein